MCVNIYAFVKVLSISVRRALIVSVLSAATNHISAAKEKGHALKDRKSPLNIKQQENKDFQYTKCNMPHI